jgi:hypothetical protein
MKYLGGAACLVEAEQRRTAPPYLGRRSRKTGECALARRVNLRHKEANKILLWPKSKFLPKR